MTQNDFNKKFEKDIDELKNQNQLLIDEINLLRRFLIQSIDLDEDEENFCPICGNFSHFQPFGVSFRLNALCSNCGSLERHRLVSIILQQRYANILKNTSIKLLHFAPERPFYNLFKKYNNIDYYPVDFDPDLYESKNIHIREKVDMENIPFEDNSFDVIYNSHVLEHIPNDINAMSELFRVLKDDGVCIVLVPLFNIPETLEKEEYNTPELRLKYYCQEDHMRKYGLDFSERLESVGFNVEEIISDDIFESEKEKKIFGLSTDKVFICTK